MNLCLAANVDFAKKIWPILIYSNNF